MEDPSVQEIIAGKASISLLLEKQTSEMLKFLESYLDLSILLGRPCTPVGQAHREKIQQEKAIVGSVDRAKRVSAAAM